jgi:2-desacetyl-2-hydroxyethyl bacteriochlorophyllide A dehydrogenase
VFGASARGDDLTPEGGRDVATDQAPQIENGGRASAGVVWDGGRNVDLVHREVPAPGTGELKIRVEASGLCGTDLHIASGEYPLALPGVVIGHEFAGTIVEAGPGVADSLGVGDRVAVDPNIPCHTCSQCHNARPHLCENPEGIGVTRDGGLAEFAIVPASQAYRVPENLPPEAAALTEPLACALHAVDLAGLRPGATALVLGAGPIGILCTALLVAAGASKVIVSEPNSNRRARVRDFGAEPVEPEAVSEADVVLECVGRVGTMKAAVEAVRPGGTVVWVGVASPEAEVGIKPYDVFRRELTIRGTYVNPFTMERSLALLDSGRINWETIVTHRFPLENFEEAWAAQREGAGLKICVQPARGAS